MTAAGGEQATGEQAWAKRGELEGDCKNPGERRQCMAQGRSTNGTRDKEVEGTPWLLVEQLEDCHFPVEEEKAEGEAC